MIISTEMENMGNDHKEKGDNSAACVIRDTDLIDQKNCPKIIHLLKVCSYIW